MKKLLIYLIALALCGIAQAPQEPMLGELTDASQFDMPVYLGAFNEGAGQTVYDLSGNGNTGTFQGTLTWLAGDIYNNKAGAVDFQTLDMPTTNGTIICGVNVLSFYNFNSLWDIGIGANDPYLAVLDHFEAWIYATGQIAARIDSIDTKCTYTLPAVGYYDIAFSWESGGNSKLYVDGILRDTQAQGTTTAAIFHIGGGNTGNTYGHAQYKYFYVFDRALTTQQIAQLYINPFPWFVEDQSYLYVTSEEEGGQVIFINFASMGLGGFGLIFLWAIIQKLRSKK